MKKVIVIGGGPAGMTAAIEAAAKGAQVTLVEKNEKLGKKLYITGKGRCNLTNDCDEETFLKNVCQNPYFLYSAIYGFNSGRIIEYFEGLGVPLKVERGGRVFPESEKASDITRALSKQLAKLGVEVKLRCKALSIEHDNGSVIGLNTDEGFLSAQRVIIATGGLSYPVTGSDGDGYSFAKATGHQVSELFPSLVPLTSSDSFVKELAGLSLKNIDASLYLDGKKLSSEFGEMLFTHIGISGPVILTLSRFYKSGSKCAVVIDLKPAIDSSELDKRILKDFGENKNKLYKNSLDKLLPQKIIPVIIEMSAIDANKPINEITRAERSNLVNVLKGFSVNINGTEGFKQAVITAGGVCVDDINPSTMESKLVKGLFFAGEVIDVDGVTGGFNLQIAFSTGMLAGSSV